MEGVNSAGHKGVGMVVDPAYSGSTNQTAKLQKAAYNITDEGEMQF